MGMAFDSLQYVAGLATLVCFILVVIAMFQHQQTGLGIICIVLAFCAIGVVIAFVYGWMKSSEWRLQNVMIIWTIAWLIGLIGGGGGYALR